MATLDFMDPLLASYLVLVLVLIPQVFFLRLSTALIQYLCRQGPKLFSRSCPALVLVRVRVLILVLQVFLTTLDFLDSVLVSVGACKEARHNHVVAALEPTVATLLNKLGDGQARLRDGAMNGLIAVARCRTAGPTFVRRVA